SDDLGEEGLKILRSEDGFNVDVKVGLSKDEIKKIIGDYDALIVRSATKVTEELLKEAKKLKVVGRAGIGLDNVDAQAATKRGIVVMNTPGGNVITTAEHTIAMMMALTRNIPTATALLKAGKWEKKKLEGRELFNKTLGLIGFGKIGSIVADRARGLKMNVIIHDPFVSPEKIQNTGFESVTLQELLKKADYITVHVPKLKSTTNLLNKEAFDQMKTGVMIINCARGGIICEADLYEAMKSGKVAGAALDVFETEPPSKLPLFELDKFICTPHLGASTAEAQTNVAVAIANQIVDMLKNGTVINAVNMPSVTGETMAKLRPYLILADRIGYLQSELYKGPIKEVVIEFSGDFKGLDLSPITTSVLKGLLTPIVKDDINFVNAPIIASERGIKITETTSYDTTHYNNLITVKLYTVDGQISTVGGTIFGKNDPRIVIINDFRLELVPFGHIALIQNEDKPGAIGSIGVTLGKHGINIAKMQVGQEEKEGKRNIIFLHTDIEIPEHVANELRSLSLIKTVTLVEL
ncbi:MAG: phosphoglycerate dehydrogenase, partial [Desulfobacterales bacterium]|nr:phosphoglycerate dehydrogenase [Desulfobacterales bacterium]